MFVLCISIYFCIFYRGILTNFIRVFYFFGNEMQMIYSVYLDKYITMLFSITIFGDDWFYKAKVSTYSMTVLFYYSELFFTIDGEALSRSLPFMSTFFMTMFNIMETD